MATSKSVLEMVLRAKDEASRTLGKVGDAVDDVGGSAEETSDAANLLGNAITAAGVVAAAKAAFELAQLGAASLRTKAAFEAISGGAGEASQNLEAMMVATRGALSEQEAMAAANQLAQMGLANNAAELGNVTEMAVRLGTAMGRDAASSIEEFSLLLANQSIPRLDTFGISAGKVRTRIQELQAATPGLTREMAFMQAVMEEGQASMERLGPATDDAALAFEQLDASVKNLKAAFGEGLAPEIASFLGILADGVGEITEFQRAFSQARESSGGLEKTIGALVPGVGALINTIQALSGETQDLSAWVEMGRHQVDGWAVSMQTANDASRQAAQESATLARHQEDLSGVFEQAASSSNVTAEALYDLSTAASKVAGSFGEMTFDNETLWNMALASGASIDALSALAQNLGIATQAEIQNTMEAYALVEAFGEGVISAQQLESGFDGLAMATQQQSIAAAEAEGTLETLQSGMIEADGTGAALTGSMDGLAGSLAGVEGSANAAQSALSRIEREINVTVTYEEHGQRPGGSGAQQHQHGTTYAPGGLALVGEAGPELVMMPRGAQVLTAGDTRRMMQTNNNFGGDTIIIQDRMAAALVMDQKRRERSARLEGRM